MIENTHEHFIFLCPNCGHEYDYKFTDEEIEQAKERYKKQFLSEF